MTNSELAVLFDLVKQHAAIIDFGGRNADKSPGYDLYPVRGSSSAHVRAMAILATAGLAQVELWNGLACHRLNEEGRLALAV